jgi:hypothetical protein
MCNAGRIQQSGETGDQRGEAEHACVDRHVFDARQIDRCRLDKHASRRRDGG